MHRNGAAEHSGSQGASGNRLLRENIAKRATEEAERTDLSGDKANHNGPWRSTHVLGSTHRIGFAEIIVLILITERPGSENEDALRSWKTDEPVAH
jgi:hypothetical protein